MITAYFSNNEQYNIYILMLVCLQSLEASNNELTVKLEEQKLKIQQHDTKKKEEMDVSRKRLDY